MYDSSFGVSEESTAFRLLDTNPLTGVRKHYPLAPRLFETAEQEERRRGREVLPPQDEAHSRALEDFAAHLRNRLGRTSLDDLWKHYLALPTPRLRYLEDKLIWRLFRHLSWVEFKDKHSSDRFFALLEECVGERIKLPLGEWHTAISFAGKWVRPAGTAEMRRAVETWMRMEEHGHVANEVTFTILFDVAVKARRWGLADTIFHELKTRKLPLDRYLRTAVIVYAGLRGDGDGVRQSFHDFVNNGEIVDTPVMNAVILALVRAGEPVAAEHVFLKMKNLSDTRFGVPTPRDWVERKEMAGALTKAAHRLRKERDEHSFTFFGSSVSLDRRREALQEASPIAPDAWTYGILLKWHCDEGNSMVKARSLLTEMRARHLIVTNAIYIVLFRGFARHGGHTLTGWSQRNLERYWAELLEVIAESHAADADSIAAANREHGYRNPGLDALGTVDELEPSPSTTDMDVHDPNSSTPFFAADLPSDADTDTYGADPFDDPEPEPLHLASSLHAAYGSHKASTDAYDPDTDAHDPSGATDMMEEEDPDSYGAVITASPVSRDHQPPHFTRPLAAAVVEAFWTCAGRARMLAVWAELQRRWPDLGHEDREYLQRIVDRHVRGGSRFRL